MTAYLGMVIGIAPEHITEYKRLHAAVWPAVLAHATNNTIALVLAYLLG